MGEMTELTTGDGHTLAAYRADPAGTPKGGLVIIQEIFGMTGQMKRCTDRYAEAGYLAILPAMFDRVERGLVLDYHEFQRGAQTVGEINMQDVLADVDAARQAVATAGRTAIIGYCWGGTIAYMGASGLPFDCALSYYGGGIGRLVDRMQPKIPVQYHFGGEDKFIPVSVIDQIRSADPSGQFHVYEGADHGFNCDDRDSYHAEASALSEQRSLEFLAAQLQG
jgi:carboxymethylenebutenolidase